MANIFDDIISTIRDIIRNQGCNVLSEMYAMGQQYHTVLSESRKGYRYADYEIAVDTDKNGPVISMKDLKTGKMTKLVPFIDNMVMFENKQDVRPSLFTSIIQQTSDVAMKIELLV